MANTVAATGLTVQQWDNKFFTEYVQANRFAKYFGTNENSLIQVKQDLTKKKGDKLTFALVNRLSGAGVTGVSTLEGNEEDMATRSHALTVNKIRNGVRVAEMDEQRSAISLRNAARATLKTWIMEQTRDDIIAALASIRTSASTATAFGSASQAQRDAWLDDNNDRAIFGNELGNTVATGGTVAYDYSGSLDLIVAGDTLDADLVSLAKRVALSANPKIRPIMIDGDEEWYVMFVNSQQYRDLKIDLKTSNTDGRNRGNENPIFTGENILWDGVIVRHIADMGTLATTNTGAVAIAPAFLCGAQAVGVGWAKRTTSVTETFDYGDKHGVAIEEIRGIEKLCFGSGIAGSDFVAGDDTTDLKDNGVVTVWTASAADA